MRRVAVSESPRRPRCGQLDVIADRRDSTGDIRHAHHPEGSHRACTVVAAKASDDGDLHSVRTTAQG